MKIFNLLLVLLITKLAVSQVNSFSFQGVKDYNSETRIAYFNLEGLKNLDEVYYVKKELLKDKNIYRFEIYKAEGDFNNCMIETTPEYDEIKIRNLINDKIKESEELKDNYKENIWEYYRIIYDIPSDCPVFEYYPITKENKDDFINEIEEWKANNYEKYQEIKHLKQHLNIPE